MERYDESPEIALKSGDVIFSKDGSLGNPALIRELPDKATINGTMMLVRLHDKVTPNFFYQVLNSDSFLRLLHVLKSGSSIPHIFQRDMENFKFKIPQSLKEQNQISSFLEVVDEKIGLLKKKYESYVNFKKYLMQQIFAQKLRFDKQNEWKTVEIKSVVSEYKEKAGDNEYPILSSTLSGIFLQSDYFDKNVNSSDTQDYKVVPKGFFTYRSMSDTGVFRFNIQNIVEKGIISPAYPVFTTENINDMFLEQYLNNSPYIKRQILTLKEGGTRYALGFNKFKKLKIEVPSVNEQNKIVDCFNTVDTKINHVDNELKNINNFKKGLLQQMFV